MEWNSLTAKSDFRVSSFRKSGTLAKAIAGMIGEGYLWLKNAQFKMIILS